MKKLVSLMLCIAMLASCLALGMIVPFAAEEPMPVYYENFSKTTADDLTAASVLVRNNSPSNLAVKVEPYYEGESETGSNMLYFTTRNKNNESTTVFKLYDLANTTTDFAMFVKVAFSSKRDNWSNSSSRFGIAYNIDGTIDNGETSGVVELRYNATSKILRHVTNTYVSTSSTNATAVGTENNTLVVAIDTFYELGIVVSNGKLYTYLNGKLMGIGKDGATSIDYTKTASGIGIFAAYTSCLVDDVRVYDSAYLPAGYDALTAKAYTGDPCAVAIPALPSNLISDVTTKKPEVNIDDLGPAPSAGTVLYEQNFDNVFTEALGATVVKDAASDFTYEVSGGTLSVSASTSSSSHGLLQLYELPKNVTSFTIVMDVYFESVANFSEKNLIGPAYAVKDEQNWSNLSLRANGTYNFTRQVDNNWVSNTTYPEGGSSRNGKYYSVEGQTWYTLCMVVTGDGNIRSYINGILQPDIVPLINDGYGIGVYIRNGSAQVDNIVVYAGQYVPTGYDDISGEGSYEDDLWIEDETEETTDDGIVTTVPGDDGTSALVTNAKDPEKTSAPDASEQDEGGCGSVLGTVSVCLIALAAGGVMMIRKRKE